MAFKEVVKAPSQREIANLESNYRAICKKYDSAKYQFIDAVSSEDFEVLPVTAYLELKELYIQKKKLYWKIHELKHPEDTATREAYRFLNSMDHNTCLDFLARQGLTTHDLIREIEKNPNYLDEVTA
ncbi:MAG: hypothetical protein IKQ31_05750 [Clostridia bacterium]|nr:hypothetical protein [Clostridia bacterium]